MSSLPPLNDPRNQPAINAPKVVLGLMGVLAAIHVVFYALGEGAQLWSLNALAFIPARYGLMLQGVIGFDLAAFWTPVTYAFLHGGWDHLLMNSLWLLIFGSPVAWRFGPIKFMVFFAVTAAIAAFAHMATEPNSLAPLVGASGAISAMTGAALRFAFRSDPLSRQLPPKVRYALPALSFQQMANERFVVMFFLFWLASNLVFIGSDTNVAWFAHIGGFAAGLLLFPLFDKTRSAPVEDKPKPNLTLVVDKDQEPEE